MTGDSLAPEDLPADAVVCYPPAEDEVVEGRVVPDPLRDGVGALLSADHWPAFQKMRAEARARAEAAEVVIEGVVVESSPPFVQVWHDEASRLEARGRLDRGGCECADCLGDKYSGEDYY